jgi:CDP-diacylglycerol--serine O-phosphatidyltransferase
MTKTKFELVKENNPEPRFKILPLSRLFPNMVTLMALCSGMFSIRFALNEKWEMSVTFIAIAALLDGMDGRLARLLKATSNFGAQLDSLSDFLSFGVAPAIILYLWILKDISVKGLGWAISLFYAVCMAIRLARFNTSLDEEDPPIWADKFFVGVPAPAAACLAIIPIMVCLQYDLNHIMKPGLIGTYILIIAGLMISRVPTFSAKKIVIRREFASLVLVAAGVLITSILIEPWPTLTFICCCYICTIPFSIIYYKKLKNIHSSRHN